MKTRTRNSYRQKAFTLVELLVVMLIIVIMAGVAFPAFIQAQLSAKMNGAMQQARQIGLSLVAYAGDHDGQYPSGENSYGQTIATSNDAFRSLLPDYVDNEAIFAVGGSKWGPQADAKIGTTEQILEAGENHFSYIAGLSNIGGSMLPLVVDGTDGTGYYNRNPVEKGGLWKGQKAVVIRNDISAKLIPLRGPDDQRYIPSIENEDVNMLDVSESIGSGVVLLDPS